MAFSDYYTTTALNTTLGDGTFIGPNMARNDVREALQQLAADGRGLYDYVVAQVNLATGPTGPAGTVADFTGTLVNSGGGDRLTRRVVNTDGTNRTDSEFREYFDTRTSNVVTDPIDDIVGFGFNVGANGAPADTAKVSYALQMERLFAQSPGATDGGSEGFFQLYYPTGIFADPQRRPIGFIAYHGMDGSTPTCTTGFETTNITFSQYSDKALVADFNVETGNFALNAVRLGWNNNVNMLMALDFAGNQTNLLKFGTDDTIQWTAASSINAVAKTHDLLGRKSLVTWNCVSGLAANDAIHIINGPSLTAFYHYFQDFAGESTAGIANRLANATGPARYELNGTGATGVVVNGNKVVGGQQAAIADITVTATAGTLPTANGSITIADAATPTVTELLEYCRELEAKVEALLAACRSHGLIAT